MKFSIIIPVYNAENSIDKSIQCIISQQYTDWELVLIDDGSTDNSWQSIEKYVGINQNIKGYRQLNAGAGAARNHGISKTTGDYIVFLDSDDYVDKDYLSKVYNTITLDNSDVIFISVIRETSYGKVIEIQDITRHSKRTKEQLMRMQMTGKIPWGCVRKVVRADLIKSNNLMLGDIRVGEEIFFSFSVLFHAKKISFQPEAIYHYVMNDKSLTSNDTINNSLEVYNFLYESLNDFDLYNTYSETVRSFSFTIIVVMINVLCKNNKNIFIINKQSKALINNLKPHLTGKIDKYALDWKVKALIPLIRSGFPAPIILLSYFLTIAKKIKGVFV
ncbi:MAG: glycosyltransferase family 2 protein [Acholeplasma sp.]|nr:glycosyltransferase family 2 protein [Acholeplasma sp.]